MPRSLPAFHSLLLSLSSLSSLTPSSPSIASPRRNLRHCWLLAPRTSLSLVLFPPFFLFFFHIHHCRRVFVNKNRRARQAVWLSRENGNPILVLRPLKGVRARLPIRNARKFYGSALRAAICQMKNRPSTAQWNPVEKLDRSCPPVHRDFCTQTEVPPPKVIYKRHVYKCKVESRVFHA